MNSSARFGRRWKAGVAAAAVILALAVPATAIAQREPPAQERPAFEAATIKLAAPNASADTRNRMMQTSPNRLSIPNATLSGLIYNAYGNGGLNTAMRVTGGPDWTDKTMFAVEGVAAARATPRQLQLMLQRLLEDRFALKVRMEVTSNDMLTLVPARSDGSLGPKIKTWSGACPDVMPVLYFPVPRRPLQTLPASEPIDPTVAECPTGYRANGIFLDGVTMATVAEVLSLPPARGLLGTLVSDQTGLTGRYTMELNYPFFSQRPADPAAPADLGPPSLFTAVQEQWGLRLVPGKGQFRLVVVESAQLPAPN
jgi:uncharacterized protein (TIGR03435 family)